MKEKLTTIIRILFGSLILLFGLNKGLNFIALPTPPETAFPFWTGLITASFMMPTVMIIEILVGISLLINKGVKSTLLLMLPITYGFIMYHLFLDLSGIVLPIVLGIFHLYLIYVNRNSYKCLFS
jgi:putative oxidoreductase